MTQITDDHVEWAVVDRLRLMLEEPPHKEFNVTQTYALFTGVLCWVMQRIRTGKIESDADRAAAGMFERLSAQSIGEPPWAIPVAERIVRLDAHSIHVPAPRNFEDHTAGRFLINLRDAVAHGDARNVLPFNAPAGSERLLAGFTFRCSERDKSNRGKIAWQGEITLLEDDMRRIGGHLAKLYCDALRRSNAHRGDSHFGTDAAHSVREVAA